MSVRESQIEDILAAYPHVAQTLIGSDDQLRLIARQMTLPSGRLDLLFSAGIKLVLIELKVVSATVEHVEQVRSYQTDLKNMQQQGKLINGPIQAILLCPEVSPSVQESCKALSVLPVTYSMSTVLESYFRELHGLAPLISIRPSDHGLWNIYLINRVMCSLLHSHSLKDLAVSTGLSARSIANHLRFARDLCLVEEKGSFFELSSLGREFTAHANLLGSPLQLTEEQAQCLRNFIIKDPFITPTIFGIYTMVDVVFTLSRNGYPIPRELALTFFRETCGKIFEWASPTTARHGMRMYSNYSAELGLLGTVGQNLYLTPDGLRFILLLQLHKSIKMIDVLNL